MATAPATAATPHKPLYTHLYVQVLTAIVLGILLGHFYPDIGAAMKPLGDGFIKLIKMLIAPIIFCTVVHGIASMGDMKKVGRVGLKALIYFEIVTTLALIVGLIVVNILQPGVGMNIGCAHDRYQVDPGLHHQGRAAEHGRIPDAHHSQDRRRRVCRGRDPAGSVLRHPVRIRAVHARRARPPGAGLSSTSSRTRSSASSASS